MMRPLLACWIVCCGTLGSGALLAQEGPSLEPTYRLPPIVEEQEGEVIAETRIGPEEPEGESIDAFAPPRRRSGSSPGGDRSPYNQSLFWIPQSDLRSQQGALSMFGGGVNLGFPAYIAEDQVWLITGGVHQLEIDGHAMLQDSGIELPDELWKVSIGAMHTRELANGWQAGGMLSVGSNSDEPFAGLRDMTATVLAFLNVPHGERNAWNFSLFYSPTSQLPFPIPGLAYDWNPNDQWRVKIGVPFSMEYRPTETFTLSASYTPLTNVRVFGRQQLGDAWQLYAGYEVVNETYFLADRVQSDDLLYFFDQRVRVGVERSLLWGFSADFSVGYVFDREIFQAESFSGDRRDEISLEPGVIGMLSILWRR